MKYEENQNNLNYNIIQNLKNFEKKLNQIKQKYMKEYIMKVKKYISLIQNLQNKKSYSFKINFKTLKNNTSYISHIDK